MVDYDGFHIKSLTVVSYTVFGTEPCRISRATPRPTERIGFRYQVGVCDYGEPGPFARFQVFLFNRADVLVHSADNPPVEAPRRQAVLRSTNANPSTDAA